MRVLYIITGLATGGAETMLLKLLERLDRTRFELVVIALTGLGEIGPGQRCSFFPRAGRVYRVCSSKLWLVERRL